MRVMCAAAIVASIVLVQQNDATAGAQTGLDAPKLAASVLPSTVLITGRTSSGEEVTGSGFIVSSTGTIVTNLHVVQGLSTATVTLQNRETFARNRAEFRCAP